MPTREKIAVRFLKRANAVAWIVKQPKQKGVTYSIRKEGKDYLVIMKIKPATPKK